MCKNINISNNYSKCYSILTIHNLETVCCRSIAKLQTCNRVDDGFKGTLLATSAYSCAQQLIMWLSEEGNYLHADILFGSTLLRALHECFRSS